ncbi:MULTISPECIES: isoprenylcysteine carboxylmethyltransferase family protein [unclassified Leptolyngbya]|uniref:methyltransferase family protein n=1 Tax=unclassified Leptolyngbya TaxID=2650499 RepID=UPI001683A0B3|nr:MULTISPECIES: isoprenylcysteine carboxylmethyltransferase family protein [unclassified Leptolyngbya]MBD1912051.1 isoprenylcysteine carboxylmethyltransferase family protein [Leptolyngbya sp. FACHB-8]MBD2155421.1 isoprenylcysteine carboxylmethyltransferase family protein [Leptolyngbya sp. FACHB-16]
MKLLSDWGFTREGWRTGQRGEYWVLLQGFLLLGVVLLPVYRLPSLTIIPPGLYGLWGIAGAIALLAIILLGKGLLDLGQSLTPLPFPREDGQLVQTGVYGLVRHPIYSGLILGILSYAIAQQSLSHLLAAFIFILFFNAKASREEIWLTEKYPDYADYRQRAKKLIPWIY